jgi:hypothetical protein
VPYVDHALAEPLTDLPARRPGSIRRTSSVDMIARDDGTVELRSAAADPSGSASCRAVVGSLADRTLLSLDPVDGFGDLLGRTVGRGFRAVVDGLCEPGTLTWVLLSELPVATLLSGYASLYTGRLHSPLSDAYIDHLPVDICAGWAEPASFVVQIRTTREMPTPAGPVSPPDDPGEWHAMALLEPGQMRRQRLLQRDGAEVWAMFRDTYARANGVVTVLHEYSVEATMSSDDGVERIASCVATPRVLPWGECPQAAASASRLVGHRVADLRRLVKDEFTGISTCTHLNDLLASLAQADHLV